MEMHLRAEEQTTWFLKWTLGLLETWKIFTDFNKGTSDV
jgi:hypothetical protein